MKSLMRYLKNYRRECVLAPLFKMLEASFELLVPLVMAAIIDRGIGMGDRPFILRMALVLAAPILLAALLTLLVRWRRASPFRST